MQRISIHGIKMRTEVMTPHRNVIIALALVTALSACGRKQRGSDGTPLTGSEITIGETTSSHDSDNHDAVAVPSADAVASGGVVVTSAGLLSAPASSPNLDLLEAGRPAHDIVCTTSTDGKADPNGFVYSRW